jgi:glycosyltransferase
MKISIITATYNSANTIATCMKSVVNQDYKNIEYLIIDGNSKDATMMVVQDFAKNHPQIKYVSEPDKGIYDALNKGIAAASGDVIGFVHSDDFLASKTIITAIVKAFKEQQVDGVYGNLHYVAIENTDKIVRNWVSEPFQSKLLKRGWMPAHPTLYLKKSIYDKYGVFNIAYKIAADYEFILRIFKLSNLKFAYLPQTIVKMRVGGASNRNLRNLIQKTKEDYKAISTHIIGGVGCVLYKNFSKIKQFVKK